MTVMRKFMEEGSVPENASADEIRNLAKKYLEKSKLAPDSKLSEEMLKLKDKRMKQFKTLITR